MQPLSRFAIVCLLTVVSPAVARSPFDGTWRPDPQRPEPGRPADVIQLSNGEYQCQSCKPPYQVKADGIEHPISGNPRFDSLSVQVVEDSRIVKVAKRNGITVVESTVEVSADGQTLTERQILSDAGQRPVDFTSHSTRIAAGPPGSHRVSGSWRLIEADLTNHDEDTSYLVADGFLTMSDRMGRSFKAKLDGTDASYQGDSEVTSVSVKQIDARTIEETDKSAGQAVKITRWTVDPDGKTIHVRFDDTHGHVQQQDGHKIR
jgi:hypothetical protein